MTGTLETPHVQQVSGIFQANLVAFEEEFELILVKKQICTYPLQDTMTDTLRIKASFNRGDTRRAPIEGVMPSNISSVVEFYRWWVLKSKIFDQKSIYSEETIVFFEYGEHQFVKNWA